MRTSIESVVRGKIPEVRRRVVELLEFVDTGAMAAGFSYPFETVLLKRGKIRLVKPCLVKGACTGGRPVFAVTIGAFDCVVTRLRLRSGSVGRGFMVSGAGETPGGLGRAMVSGMTPP